MFNYNAPTAYFLLICVIMIFVFFLGGIRVFDYLRKLLTGV